ncbi:coproporphyrinogen-III oxidase family protein [Streptomyces sp. NPDC059618]|uniref:coproporphyrinogen-III oxidase family protein n=1 Tax=Streptomyces sp. NPDC059618 TaxID=3346887 RepID=UPI0036A5A5B1
MAATAPSTEPPQSTPRRPGLGIRTILAENPHLEIERDKYNINVTANYGDQLDAAATTAALAAHDGARQPTHLYFHVPLCSYICHFCNYVKRLAPTGDKLDENLDRWTELLLDESRRQLAALPWLAEARVESVYFGGGTASLLRPAHLRRLMDHVKSSFDLLPGAEISLEGNPDNFLQDEVEQAAALGFNRFSIGVQSLQSEVNTFAGRKHDREMSLQALGKLGDSGLPFNADMMFGLPHQTVQTVADDITTLIAMETPTITIYRLRNADREQMGIGNRSVWNVENVRERISNAGLWPSHHETYEMREAIVERLLDAGYHPSPCGWWNQPGTYGDGNDGNIPQVSRNKWQRFDSMIAVGPGAYGWATGQSPEVVQTHNLQDIAQYMSFMAKTETELPLSHGRRLTDAQSLATALGFNFKANQLISVRRYQDRYGVDLGADEPLSSLFAELTDRGLVTRTTEGYLPTLDGESLHEEIISTYFHERIGGIVGERICRR